MNKIFNNENFTIKKIILLLALITLPNKINAQGNNMRQIKITVNGKELIAVLEDNATSRALLDILPITLPMMDLYGREMCYRFDRDLPTDNVRNTNYEVGDIIYYPPRRSFVIMYKQNGERFSMQKIGKIISDIEVFNSTGDVEVSFDIIK